MRSSALLVFSHTHTYTYTYTYTYMSSSFLFFYHSPKETKSAFLAWFNSLVVRIAIKCESFHFIHFECRRHFYQLTNVPTYSYPTTFDSSVLRYALVGISYLINTLETSKSKWFRGQRQCWKSSCNVNVNINNPPHRHRHRRRPLPPMPPLVALDGNNHKHS